LNRFFAAVKNKYIGVNIMSTILIPENQEIYPNPNTHINFEFDNSIEEYRTSRYLNQILKMFGPDVILWGLTLEDYTYNDNLLTLNFTNGSLIQDSTLIKILYSFSQQINTPDTLYTSYTHPTTNREFSTSDYSVVVYTDFKYIPVTEIPTSNPQIFTIKTCLYKDEKLYNSSLEEIFFTDRNRMILYASSIANPNSQYEYITINGLEYKVRGTTTQVFEYEQFDFDGGELSIC
jgi:hypothetical protein